MILMELSKLIILRWAIPETLRSPQGAVASADAER
jgi:hypothetical protein